MLEWATGKEEAELGADEADSYPGEESVDEFLLFQSAPGMKVSYVSILFVAFLADSIKIQKGCFQYICRDVYLKYTTRDIPQRCDKGSVKDYSRDTIEGTPTSVTRRNDVR